jgi:hypothetical protein
MEDKLQSRIARAGQAESLLRNGLLNEAFAKLEADYITAWKGWQASDTDGRERLWMAVNVLGKIKEHLTRVISDGRLAQAELDDLISKKPN